MIPFQRVELVYYQFVNDSLILNLVKLLTNPSTRVCVFHSCKFAVDFRNNVNVNEK